MRRNSRSSEFRGRAAAGRAAVLVAFVLVAGACGGSDPGGTATPATGDTVGGGPADSSDVGTIVVTIGTERFEFVTSPPRIFDFDGNQYGSCLAIAGILQASGYTTDGSEIVANIQVTEPGETGSRITVKDGSSSLNREDSATFLWGANRAGRPEGDPLYTEVAEDRTLDGSGASGTATFVDFRAETPEQVSGSFEVNCTD